MDKVWLKRYPSGVPAEIDADHYPSLLDIFSQSISQFADNTAFINMGKSISYRELDKLSKAFAAYLQKDLGLKKGDAVAIMMPNLLQYPVVLMGVLRAGCTVVNVNPLYTPRELQHQLSDSKAKAIVIVDNFAHTLAAVRLAPDGEEAFFARGDQCLGGLAGQRIKLFAQCRAK